MPDLLRYVRPPIWLHVLASALSPPLGFFLGGGVFAGVVMASATARVP